MDAVHSSLDRELQPVVRAFRGFGTDVELRLWPRNGHGESAVAAIEREVAALHRAERLLSRFRPDSEIARINLAGGVPVHASPLTCVLIAEALDAAGASGGVFDPTVGAAVIAAGYDRSFERVAAAERTGDAAPAIPAGRFAEVEVNVAERTVVVPVGIALDLGGIAKGWLAGRCVRRLCRHGRALVDLGGDIAVSAPEQGGAWEIDLVDPFDDSKTLGLLRLARAGGVATSGVLRRRWTVNGTPRHHIIDPRTGRPAETDLVAATIIAPSPAAAEVAAKAALILGRDAAIQALQHSGRLAGVLVRRDGSVECAAGVHAHRWLRWQACEEMRS